MVNQTQAQRASSSFEAILLKILEQVLQSTGGIAANSVVVLSGPQQKKRNSIILMRKVCMELINKNQTVYRPAVLEGYIFLHVQSSLSTFEPFHDFSGLQCFSCPAILCGKRVAFNDPANIHDISLIIQCSSIQVSMQ